MSRKKLERFAHNQEAANVIQAGKELYSQIKGKWRELYFKNENPICLELACGHGEYTTGLAALFPDTNFIGVDIKGARFWKGSSLALVQNLGNVAFLRTHIQNLELFFEAKEINEIWLTFPDPRPKDKDERRRLSNPRFLKMYENLLTKGGIMHFKTDNEALFDYTLEVLKDFSVQNLQYTKDLYASDLKDLHYGIQTTYELMFSEKGFKINYLQFSFSQVDENLEFSPPTGE